MKDVLVVGSMAYDSISTPEGRRERALGGSANYFSVATSLFSQVRVVGVVGSDYLEGDLDLLRQRGVDCSGVARREGKTFHWEGRYEGDMNEAITIRTELNVFERFKPELPEAHRKCPLVFLANIDPELQLSVLDQMSSPQLIGIDTMNFWIKSKFRELSRVLERAHVVLINEAEALMLTKETNVVRAVRNIAAMGPRAVVVKRGEYGFMFFSENEFLILPAFPLDRVVDPTGAGDSFAGGFFGHLAQTKGEVGLEALRKACISGTLLASFTVQGFGMSVLSGLTRPEIESRWSNYKKVIEP